MSKSGFILSEKERILSERIRELQAKVSELQGELGDIRILLEEANRQKEFYQLIADFTFGWELWLDPGGKVRYCSPSCLDITGYTANQIIAARSTGELLVYEPDKDRFNQFLTDSLGQLLLPKSLEFRILTRHRQLRWCLINVRGVYDLQGRYLGIRASVQDITKLKRALGHIHDLSDGKEMENKAKTRLRSQLDQREREMVSFLLQLSAKNEVLSGTVRHLKKITTGNPKVLSHKLQELIASLEEITPVPVDWQAVTAQIDNLHPGFLRRLELKHPNLTIREKKLAVYLRLGLTSREIAGLQNISPESVETARVRLRKKLKLSEKLRLTNYVEQV